MRYTDCMIRKHQGYKKVLKIARKQYRDAVRRYIDAEGDEQISRFKALKAKIDEKFGMLVHDHPELIKYSKKFAVICSRVLSIMSGIAAAGFIAIDIRVIRAVKKAGFELRDIAGLVPNKLALLISSIAAVVFGFAGWAEKRAKETTVQDDNNQNRNQQIVERLRRYLGNKNNSSYSQQLNNLARSALNSKNDPTLTALRDPKAFQKAWNDPNFVWDI